jgi:polysaccharide transporter, PST family
MIDYFDDHRREDDHVGRSIRGGAMSVFARAITAVIQIGSVLFLARLLSPEDYGLVSMVMAFVGFAPLLTDLGMQDMVSQAARITRGEISALFWITMGVGTAFAAMTAAAGPLIARFYGEPRLTPIVLVCSLTFIASALTIQHSALMRRALLFWELGIIEVGANVLTAIVAIAIAFRGNGYWALVVRPIGTPLLMACGVWMKCRWLPGRPTLTPNVRRRLGLGLNITGCSLADYAGRSGDRIAIGARAGAVILGQYQNALMVYDNLANILVAPLHSVAVASLSKMRDDVAELRRAWGKALSTVSFYAMPAFGLLAATSQDVVVLLLGSKWSSAGVLLGVLAFRGIPHCVERTNGWLHVTAGRTDRFIRYGVFAAGVQIAALACGLPFGPIGIAAAYVVSMFLLFVPALAYAGRPLGIGAVDVVRIVWRPLVASLASAATVIVLRSMTQGNVHASLRLALCVTTYVLSYLLIVIGILGLRAPIRTARLLIEHSFPLRFAPLQ